MENKERLVQEENIPQDQHRSQETEQSESIILYETNQQQYSSITTSDKKEYNLFFKDFLLVHYFRYSNIIFKHGSKFTKYC